MNPIYKSFLESNKYDSKKIKNLLKDYDITIPASGNAGLDIQLELSNEKTARNSGLRNKILKILQKEYPSLIINKASKDYPGGYHTESSDWRKNDKSEPHDLYISFKEK